MLKSKSLFLSYDGLTDPLGQSQVLPYLEGLSKEFKIYIISFEKKERYDAQKDAILKKCEKAGIIWCPLMYHKNPPVLSTLFDIYQMYALSRRLILGKAINLVHARSYISGLVALWLKAKFNVAYIFDIRGFWPEERVEGGIWNLNNKLYKKVFTFFKRREVDLFTKANAVISLTYKAKDILLNRKELNLVGDKVTVIPCCADLDHFQKLFVNDTLKVLREKLSIAENQFVLTYCGSIGTWYMLEEMLSFFNQLTLIKPDSVFLFVTKEPASVILDKCQKFNIQESSIRVISATYGEVPQYLSIADASVYFIRPSYSKQASSPTKQAELLAMNIPIITNAGVGDSDKILKDVGILVNDFEPDTLRLAGEKLVLKSEEKTESRFLAKEYYSLEKGISKYKMIYNKILN